LRSSSNSACLSTATASKINGDYYHPNSSKAPTYNVYHVQSTRIKVQWLRLFNVLTLNRAEGAALNFEQATGRFRAPGVFATLCLCASRKSSIPYKAKGG